MSPRAKIAQITNGVGRTQQTMTNRQRPMKSRNDEATPIRIATTVTAIISHARLNWNRGSGNHRRDGSRLEKYPAQACFIRLRTSFLERRSRIIPFRQRSRPNKACGIARTVTTLAIGRWRLGGGATTSCRARAMSSWAVSAGLSSAMPCCKRICSSRSTAGSKAIGGCRTHAFRDAIRFGLRAAREHGDEFAVFELGQDVHFAKRLFERWHGGFDHLPSDRAAVLAIDDVVLFDLQIQDRQRNAEAMAFGYAPLEHLDERGSGWRRLLGRRFGRRLRRRSWLGDLDDCSASVIGTWVSPVCQWPQLRPAFFEV